MSNSLIKANYVNIGQDKKRVIDSNQAVNDRISLLNELLERQASSQEDFLEDFSEGLDAEMVDALLVDQDGGEPASGVIRQEDIDAIITQAQEEAQSILDEADRSAKGILDDASSQAENLKAQAYEEGKSEGYQAGYNEGMAQTAQMEQELNERMQQIDAAYEEQLQQLEPMFVQTLTDIYSHVLGVDLSGQSEVVLHLLRNAIRNIEGGKNFFVHVSSEDYGFVNDSREELLSGLASSCVVEVIEDLSLSQGQCFVEAESGIFDCGLGTQLELLKKELRMLSYSAQ